MGKLDGKVAIITGGASGIGKATASLFVKEGAKVAIVDINEKLGKRTEKGLGNSIFVKCDTTKSNDVKKMVENVIRKFGEVDILFNNAGIYIEDKFLDELEEDVWDKVLDTNLKSVYLCSKYVLPIMKRNKAGAIINTSSGLGLVPEPWSPAYCTSKAGIIHLTKVMAVEYATYGIRVNCVCPGPIDTPLIRRAFANESELKEYAEKQTLAKRLGKPEEVANVVLFLASDDSSYMNGSIVTVDAGESLG